MKSKDAQWKVYLDRHRDILICLFLGLVTFTVYRQVLNHEFVYDDSAYVTENRHIQGGLTLKGIAWAFTAEVSANRHPLTLLSHMLDCQLHGLNAGRHHLTNLIFHTINTMLLFLVFRRMTGALWQSAFVAALFALHPLHVESVAWISERKDVLSTFFCLLTMWAYARYAEGPRVNRYLLVFLFFALGLMSKPMLVTLPFVLLLLDYWPLKRFRFGRPGVRLIMEKVPLFALSAASCVLTYLVQHGKGAVASLDVYPIGLRIGNALVSYVLYPWKMIWPSHLAVIYPYSRTLPWWQVAGACVLLVTLTFLILRAGKKHPHITVGWLWYIGTLVPVIGLVQVGSQAMADRYTYIPLVGLFIMIAWGFPELLSPWRQKKSGLTIMAVILLLIMAWTTFLQIRYWKNNRPLFEHALDVTSGNFIAHNNLANTLTKQGHTGEAVIHYKKALRLKPDYAEAYNNMGFCLKKQDRIKEAVEYYGMALHIEPRYAKAHYNLGNIFYEQGLIGKAIEHHLQAVRINPDYVEAHNNLGSALKLQGRIVEAVTHYNKALRLKPDCAEAYYNLGVIFAKQGRLEEAMEYYDNALGIRPDLVEAHNGMGLALSRKGDIQGAIHHFRKALQINPGYVSARNNLKKISNSH